MSQIVIKPQQATRGKIFLELSPDIVMESFFQARRDAEANRETENKAALLIQKTYKSWIVRSAYIKYRHKIITIQRVFRGYLYGRRVKRQLQEEREKQDRTQLYHYCAIQIQRIFRGFWVRKYVHNYYKRKEYLAFVEHQSSLTNDYVEQYRQQRSEELQDEKEKKDYEKFQEYSKSLHHLVSTKTIPGVYKPNHRYISEDTVYGIPVEEQLRYVAKTEYINTLQKRQLTSVNSTLLRTTNSELKTNPSLGYLYPDQVKGSNSTTTTTQEKTLPPINEKDKMRFKDKRHGPFKPPEQVQTIKEKTYERSIQSSCKYDADKEANRFENMIEKDTRISKKLYAPCKKKKDTIPGETILASDKYVNPVRSITRKDDKDKQLNYPFKPTQTKSGVFDNSTIPFVQTSIPHAYRK